MKVLVTGHRGYIGSVMTTMLQELGIFCIGVDNAPDINYVDLKLNSSITANCSDDTVIEYFFNNNII